MAKIFSDCTPALLFVLLGLAACIVLATSALSVQRVHVREAASAAIYLESGVRLSVSYCRLCLCSCYVLEVCTVMFYGKYSV